MGQLTSFVFIRAYPRHPRSNFFFFRRMVTASRRRLFLTWLRPHAALGFSRVSWLALDAERSLFLKITIRHGFFTLP
jgi:hypothetical protein